MMQRTLLLSALTAVLSSCEVGEEGLVKSYSRLVDDAKKACSGEPLVGQYAQASLKLEADIKKLKAPTVDMTVETKRGLSQELENYRAEIEVVNQRYQRSCIDYHICKQQERLDSGKSCKDETDQYKDSQNKADELFGEIFALQIPR